MSAKRRELEQKIGEMEAALAQLKQQLNQAVAEEQHESIDHLDDHLQEMDHKWENIRDFWPIVVQEFRDRFGKK
ncbi:hypothetical protein [Ketobacter sp.]|uniref:hypothetical protein n=1 Tax=Ketobacter sp. TaxID=2083498 RepID=UPI000F218864|nr:hypothetical protein [Ketobacter sp.]RLU02019.1 MAG: hypothetical protein D9N14_00280 [Ketobacter sp.]